MRISPINNTSFGKLRISKDPATKEALNEIIRTKEDEKDVRKSLNKIDKLTGRTEVELTMKKDERMSNSWNTYYAACLNSKNHNWKPVEVGRIGAGAHYIEGEFEGLVEKCAEEKDRVDNITSKSDFDNFYKEFGSEYDDNKSKSVILAKDYTTRSQIEKRFESRKKYLNAFAETLREIEKNSCGHKFLIALDSYFSNPKGFVIRAAEVDNNLRQINRDELTASCELGEEYNENAKELLGRFKNACIRHAERAEGTYWTNADALIASYQ